ncbi:MAG TPA: Gfo/Idh/MocA family oxidoreductase [Candidatus Acidoferrum sp.]|nr:Gfo/Idh/MocA family oxidoreductase [Candidatus Acidoferrum sp.]
MSKKDELSRRTFLTQAAAAGAAVTIVPRHVLGRGYTPPSDLLNIAGVGVGGMGRNNLINLASQNIVALCDVDWGYAGKSFDRLDTEIPNLQKRIEEPPPAPPAGEPAPEFDRVKAQARLDGMIRLKNEHLPKAKRYQDFRIMLEQQKDIDAVVVATSDHMHAPIALAAMALGKHVYVQKPLTYTIDEARQLSRRAKETRVATQMGNQGHSFDDARLVVEYIQAGAIGEVREAHIWTNRPLGFWPQGIPRPEPLKVSADKLHWSGRDVDTRLAAAMAGDYPVPDQLSWELFLGVAPKVDYHPVYHPFNWRGWSDWGVGAIGDMGAHLIDHTFWALDLGMPTTVETVSTPFNGACYPHATQTFYEFPARGSMPPVKLTWYDGGLMPDKPVELGDEDLNKGGGALLVGSKGKLLHDTYGLHPRLLPKSLHDSYGKPPQKLPRVEREDHEMNWVNAAKGRTAASCPFEYASRLTEVMLLGIVALRAGKKIAYDGSGMRVTNVAAANDFLRRDYRQGWA